MQTSDLPSAIIEALVALPDPRRVRRSTAYGAGSVLARETKQGREPAVLRVYPNNERGAQRYAAEQAPFDEAGYELAAHATTPNRAPIAQLVLSAASLFLGGSAEDSGRIYALYRLRPGVAAGHWPAPPPISRRRAWYAALWGAVAAVGLFLTLDPPGDETFFSAGESAVPGLLFLSIFVLGPAAIAAAIALKERLRGWATSASYMFGGFTVFISFLMFLWALGGMGPESWLVFVHAGLITIAVVLIPLDLVAALVGRLRAPPPLSAGDAHAKARLDPSAMSPSPLPTPGDSTLGEPRGPPWASGAG